ncbi:MAG TPA: FIST N-terminal domain-containing protein [Phycisphaerae bacterium]|nr:FIST C-terminal domain-containing protein [Phycisphaerales bacterium]HNO79706.1 FIST N-terminal domain-containing protein [Phycisphaerae bacterium]
MEFVSKLTLRRDMEAAVHDLCVDVKSFKADLAFIFASHHHGPEFHELISSVYNNIDCRNLLGCTGESIIGPTAEIEAQPAIALWAARLPDVRVSSFVFDQQDLQILEDAPSEAWFERIGVRPEDSPSFVLLPDPFSINAQLFIERMDMLYPGSTIVGGMASGATEAGQNRLFVGDQALRQGLVGVALSGNIDVSSVVSQGCRQVGDPFVITKSHDNLIEELGGKPALDVLRNVFNSAPDEDQKLMRTGLHVGRLIDEHVANASAGDFLIRNMMGVTEQKALAVGDFLRPGQTVQFHVRDSRSATEEMQRLLSQEKDRQKRPVSGALLFNCNGRGRRFFKEANHDIGLVNNFTDQCSVAGFFAQGEIGPVGGKTFVHGFTSSLALFREPSGSPADPEAK